MDTSASLSDTSFWINAFAPSIPSVITVAAGFYIFHKLALRRQVRQEIFSDISDIKQNIDEVLKHGTEAWSCTGIDAQKKGHVVMLRGRLAILSAQIESLISRDSRYSVVQDTHKRFRASLDEYRSGAQNIGVDDQTRGSSNIGRTQALSYAGKLRREIDALFTSK
ncbi:MAG: hypothetical protein ABJN98_20085 [Roseibium sp.]|uniref:hypothetical protein n=1 Tax=Roseibium polysiphoniae TaxID=2571221 RepID=UPI0032998E04